MAKKKYPISRVTKFYSEGDFRLENEMAREFVEDDLDFKVVLFQVDRIKSQTDDVWGESDAEEIKFLPPKEINVRPLLGEPKQNTYSDGFGQILEYGDFSFTVFNDHLEELKIDIRYGDYVGYVDREDNIKYYTVINDGRINTDNAHTRLGYKSYYRTIVCVNADVDEFDPNY
jgi:hypothetical protein